ncbi:MAG: thioesterase family protein [Pseudobdellovibrionaceae bacterium]|nr:thioesterase family protein [Pseudobdellovibrionaceae bacterium]
MSVSNWDRSFEVEYYKEVHLLDGLRVTLAIVGLSANGGRFCMRNEFFVNQDKLMARVNSTCAWLDLGLRKLTPPPTDLLAALDALPKSDDFRVL